MPMQTPSLRVFAFVAGLAIFACSGYASADPPSRVARLGYTSGAVSFSPAGENDWLQATINRPLGTGDRLWTEASSGSRAEVQVGGALVRMNAGTGISILNLDDRIAQLQLTQGTLNVRVRRLVPGQVFEVDTPNLAFTLRKPGAYRIRVDPDGNATTIVVRQGQGEAYGEGAAYVIDARQAYRFTGTGLRDYRYVDASRPDEFDRWSNARDSRYDSSRSARYVSPDVIGYQDLDSNGYWRTDPGYGNVWIPNRVAAGWAPYQDGHWAWIDPWGWTWVDDAPWGFAVSHYGRWANFAGTWGWVPGPTRSRAYYAPALVAFVGGAGFQLSIASGNVGGIGWFPLAPREVYRPAYPVSRGYFENINRSNTVINTTIINNAYRQSNVSNVTYANRRVAGAVVAVPSTAFVQSQPVSRTQQRVPGATLSSAPVVVVPPVAPGEKSMHGPAARGDKPPPHSFERPVIARGAPPAAHAGFEAQRQQLSAQPGKPLDDAARRELKPAESVPVPIVKVVSPPEAPRTLRPPPAPRSAGDARERSAARASPAAPAAPAPSLAPPMPAAQVPEQRGRSEARGNGERQRDQALAPPPAQRAAEPPVPPVPQFAPRQAAPPPEQHNRPEQRGNDEQRRQPMAPPPAQRAAEPPVPLVPQLAPRQAAPPPEQHNRPEQRGNDEQRRQPVAPPPPQRAAEPQIAPVTPPVPAAPPSEQRSRPEQRGHDDQRRNTEQREQPAAPPAQRAVETRAAPPTAEPRAAPPPPAAPPAAAIAPPPPPHAQQPNPEVDRQHERKPEGGEQKHNEDNRKQER